MDNHLALTHLAILLSAAFIGGAIFQKLRQPALVGYIIVGIVLGPSVLGIVQERDNITFMSTGIKKPHVSENSPWDTRVQKLFSSLLFRNLISQKKPKRKSFKSHTQKISRIR